VLKVAKGHWLPLDTMIHFLSLRNKTECQENSAGGFGERQVRLFAVLTAETLRMGNKA